MAEYINREELLKDINDSVRFSTRNGMSAELRGAHKIVDCIRSATACDVDEVVHGKWLKTKYPEQYQCSECYYEWTVRGMCRETPRDNDAFYCPCCGAKMDGENNE